VSPRHSRRLVKRLRRHRSELFTFLDHPEVPYDNNHAKRMVRPAVLVRKDSYAHGSDEGAETQAVLMSVFRTLKQPSPPSSLQSGLICKPANCRRYQVQP
jgi:transposase